LNNQVRESLIAMLNDAKSILDEQGMKFWLEYGTLLGIIRSDDFIPWETDIDLGCWKLENDDYAVKQKLKSEFQNRNYAVYLTDGHLNIRPKNAPSVWLDINFYVREGDEAVTLGWTFPTSLNRLSQIINYLIIYILNNYYHPKKFKFILVPFYGGFRKLFHYASPPLKEIIINSLITLRDSFSGSQKMSIKSKYIDNLEKIKIFGDEYLIPMDAKGYLRDGYGEDWETPKEKWDWKNEFKFIK
jgi:phosphorylcholine metabolism protein LicD